MYRARDTKLDRDVALKVLPEAFTSDADQLARFEREAKVLASLNHPNIGGIHGLEESDSVKALVLELVEGPTLADRIAQGRIPVDEALPIAKQLAEALEAAHEAGVIHRDLKPANIKVRNDGTVKVLDFGLAKAFELTPDRDPSQSPTMTAAATQMGVIVGSAAYMSPEQARGKAVDKRADVWAFGAVVYEMLTGRRAFHGETVSDTLAAVLTADIDLTALPPDVSPAVRRLLRRCLQQEPKKRLRDIADGLFELDEDPENRSGEPAASQTVLPQVATARRVLPWVAVVAVAVATSFGVWSLRPPPPPLTSDAFVVALPLDVSLPPNGRIVAALSPDGQHLVYRGDRDGTTQLYHRPLDQVDAAPIAGTTGVSFPFFSPDGEWIGFIDGPIGPALSGVAVKKVRLAGGAPETVASLPPGNWGGGTWSDDETIWLSTWDLGGSLRSSDVEPGLYQVSAAGGVPHLVTSADASDGLLGYLMPHALPDGRGILYAALRANYESSEPLAKLLSYSLLTEERNKCSVCNEALRAQVRDRGFERPPQR